MRILTILVSVSFLLALPSRASDAIKNAVHIGVFNSAEQARNFFESLPISIRSRLDKGQLWLDVYKTQRGFLEHQINIDGLENAEAQALCDEIQSSNTQCLVTGVLPLFPSTKTSERIVEQVVALTSHAVKPHIFRPLGLKLNKEEDIETLDLYFNADDLSKVTMPEPQVVQTIQQDIKDYGGAFSLDGSIPGTASEQVARAVYIHARDQFLGAVQNIGTGINAGTASETAREEFLALGRGAFEAAGEAYLSGFLDQYAAPKKALTPDASAGKAFVHHMRQNLNDSVSITVDGVIKQALQSISSGEGVQSAVLKSRVNDLFLSGARGLIEAGLASARQSDLYALRNLELQYNLNDFENAYFSALITQPIYQSVDLRHNVFMQGSAIINEQSVDIDDDTARHTANIGAAYRYLTRDEKYLVGANIFLDHQWPYNHSRMSIGADARADNLNFAANYYIPLSGFKQGRTDSAGQIYEERVLEGYDVEVGYNLPFAPKLDMYGKGYHYFRTNGEDDLRGLELGAEYNLYKNFTVKGALIEENGGRDGAEVTLQYHMPLYDVEESNLAALDMPEESMRGHIFDKVRRENRIRIEERIQTAATPALAAQFNASSSGLPFQVGGANTTSGVDIPYDSAIRILNGDFAIINFSNGALANVSASGAGDVTLEYNETTLTINSTNGGFVQYVSGTGGITMVSVPGGTVNLLGTDIDVTDNGGITTVQVRAGQISVVPDVGTAVLGGNQGNIVSLDIATGTTSLLVDPALETRQEAAFTNLDIINSSPPITDTSAPFINALPVLITGPQFIGNNTDIRVNFTQDINVTGAPQLDGFIDANARSFTYEATASSSRQLVFRHVYVAGDVGAAAVTIQELDLNGGTIIDAGNNLNAVTAFTDTVIAINDQTAPMLLSSVPVDSETAASNAANIVLTFDEPMQANIGNIILTDVTDGSDSRIIPITDGQVSFAGNDVIINLTSILDLSTDYELVFNADLIRDLSGNAFAGIVAGDLTFTTTNDNTPPMLTSIIPSDNTAGVARDANLVLGFDDLVAIGTGNIIIHRSVDGAALETIDVSSASVTGGGTNTITINPINDYPIATEVYVLIDSTAFEDINANDFAGVSSITAFSFRTFSPLDFANITLWLDGDDIDGDGVSEGASEAGIVSGDISVWVDKSGGGNNTTQSSAGNRPFFANPGANFVGATNSISNGDFMQITNGGASGMTVIAVLENAVQNISGTVNAFLDSAGSDYTFLRVAATDYKISLDGATGRQGRVAFDGDSFSATGGNVSAPGPFPTNALLYAEYASLPTNHEILGGLSTGAGAVDTSPDFRSNFILRELIMYSNAKTSDLAGIDEREALEGYLAHKYGIEARLPMSHPYKTSSP